MCILSFRLRSIDLTKNVNPKKIKVQSEYITNFL